MTEVLKVSNGPFATYSENSNSEKPVYHNGTKRIIRKFNIKSLTDCVFIEEAKVYQNNILFCLHASKCDHYYNKWKNRTFLEPFDPKKDYSEYELNHNHNQSQ